MKPNSYIASLNEHLAELSMRAFPAGMKQLGEYLLADGEYAKFADIRLQLSLQRHSIANQIILAAESATRNWNYVDVNDDRAAVEKAHKAFADKDQQRREFDDLCSAPQIMWQAKGTENILFTDYSVDGTGQMVLSQEHGRLYFEIVGFLPKKPVVESFAELITGDLDWNFFKSADNGKSRTRKFKPEAQKLADAFEEHAVRSNMCGVFLTIVGIACGYNNENPVYFSECGDVVPQILKLRTQYDEKAQANFVQMKQQADKAIAEMSPIKRIFAMAAQGIVYLVKDTSKVAPLDLVAVKVYNKWDALGIPVVPPVVTPEAPKKAAPVLA
jgi:hypothetical protein